jgi:hypothetical protein
MSSQRHLVDGTPAQGIKTRFSFPSPNRAAAPLLLVRSHRALRSRSGEECLASNYVERYGGEHVFNSWYTCPGAGSPYFSSVAVVAFVAFVNPADGDVFDGTFSELARTEGMGIARGPDDGNAISRL